MLSMPEKVLCMAIVVWSGIGMMLELILKVVLAVFGLNCFTQEKAIDGRKDYWEGPVAGCCLLFTA
jgi:hypothetical protein